MTCPQIVSKLLDYRSQLLNILSDLDEYNLEVTSQYSFITIDIKGSDQLFGQLRFEVTTDEGKLTSCFCKDDALQKMITTKVESKTWSGWTSPSSTVLPYSQQVLSSMEIADSIA